MPRSSRNGRTSPLTRPLYIDPIACAASSMTTRPCRLAISMISSIRQTRPVRWTGMMAFVLRRDRALDLLGIDVLIGKHIGEDRLRAEMDDRRRRGDERVRRGDDLVAAADARHHHGQHEGIGAGIERNRLGRTAILGNALFERRQARRRFRRTTRAAGPPRRCDEGPRAGPGPGPEGLRRECHASPSHAP